MIITLDKAQIIMWIEFLDQKNVLQISKFSQKMHIEGAGGHLRLWLYLNHSFLLEPTQQLFIYNHIHRSEFQHIKIQVVN